MQTIFLKVKYYSCFIFTTGQQRSATFSVADPLEKASTRYSSVDEKRKKSVYWLLFNIPDLVLFHEIFVKRFLFLLQGRGNMFYAIVVFLSYAKINFHGMIQ